MICTLVDTEGFPLRVIAHSAGIQDRDGAALVFDKIRQRFNWLELIWADNGYNARQVNDAIADYPGLRIEIVKRSDDMKGSVGLPRRWVVEPTFSWMADANFRRSISDLLPHQCMSILPMAPWSSAAGADAWTWNSTLIEPALAKFRVAGMWSPTLNGALGPTSIRW